MRTLIQSSLASLILLSSGVVAQDSSDAVVRMPLQIGARIEMGRVQGSDTGQSVPYGQFLSQTEMNMTQEVLVGQRLDLKIGAGGVVYYTVPFATGAPSGNGAKFAPGIAQAQAIYKLGSVSNPWGILKVGYFPYKYDPDAKNLGEYLFRGGAYPTYLTTGGWSITDNASAKLLGVGASFPLFNGAWKNDFLLTSEVSNVPTGDITPSYVTQVTAGPFQLGAGISFYHYFPVNPPSVEQPPVSANQYSVFDTLPAGTVIHYGNDSIVVKKGVQYVANGNDLQDPVTAVGGAQTSLSAYTPSSTGTYTFKAIRTMARASFNIQKLFPMPMLNPEDLKIYSEIAVLGWQDYPGEYSDRWNRTPIMAGINLPTFQLLDVFSFEGEYLNTPNPDDEWGMENFEQPSYIGPVAGVEGGEYSSLFPNASKAQWKWSFYASKKLTRGFSVVAQVASDHLRLPYTINAGTWTASPLTNSPSQWYYVIAINYGI